ncbi:putative DnaJ domain, Chaperone J-domain superfamily [Helianthus annuus]|nr:putative DnaJ domain, Chaperone J-domain superfamily [Helianthus annuus]
MECNKDEAVRAKIIAEKKLEDKDYAGAKKFTLKSQTLYPGLDGISQMLIILNVYIASEKKVNGESDWYAVLDVKPSDNDETIRKQYRKMVLMLHPDKNKSAGADGAFKILSEAWNLLSDSSKRSAYNQRRKIVPNISFQNVRPSPSSPSFVNVVHRATSKPQARPKAKPKAQPKPKPKAQAQTPPPPPPRAPAPAPAAGPVSSGKDTFWTVCRGCVMHYEYYKVYLNETILCPSCNKPFHAVETVSPVNVPNVPKPGGLGNKTNMPKPGGVGNKTNVRPLRPEVQFGMPPSGASKAANFGEKVNMNRKCEEFNAQRLAKRHKY